MFVDCAQLIADNRPRRSNGMAVVDVDGDGLCEVVVTGDGTANLVLKWDGQRLHDIADPVLADPTGKALAVAAADVDGDGREEIYVVNADSAAGAEETCDRLFATFGNRWLDLLGQAQNAGVANRLPARAVAALDREGHGRYGFLVAGDGTPFRLFELNRRGRIADVAEDAGIDHIALGRGLLCAPIVGDGMDVFAANEAGPNLLFHNLGDGTFEELAGERGMADSRTAARGAVLVDAEGDTTQLLVGSWEGPQRLYQPRPGGAFVDVADADLSMPARVRTVVAADFDNDGHVELLFLCSGERNRLFGWRDDQWTEIDPGDGAMPRAYATGAAVADLDGDGRLELLVGHGEATEQPLALFRPLPNANAWLRVQPLTPFGAPARGAVVTCVARGRRQRRVVCAGSGYLSQMEPVAHFGLGTADAVEAVEVRWPGGAVATIEAPPPCRVLTVPHPPE